MQKAKRKSFIKDESAIANALVFALFTVIVMALLYIILGAAVSPVIEIANTFATAGMIAPQILETVNWLFTFWGWFPILVCVTTAIFVIRRAIRTEPQQSWEGGWF